MDGIINVYKPVGMTSHDVVNKIRRILKEENFDVVYLHTSLASFWIRMALRGVKKKPYVINTVHGYLFGKSSGKIHNIIISWMLEPLINPIRCRHNDLVCIVGSP